MKKTIILSIFMLFITMSTASAIELTGCTTIYEDAVLINDITAASYDNPCIEFGASDITLDCQNFNHRGLLFWNMGRR